MSESISCSNHFTRTPTCRDMQCVIPGGAQRRGPMETDQLWALFKIDQQRISALDTVLIAIRGWTVTVVSAIAGFSLSKNDHSILLAAMGGTVLFGLLDVEYRRTQLLHAS